MAQLSAHASERELQAAVAQARAEKLELKVAALSRELAELKAAERAVREKYDLKVKVEAWHASQKYQDQRRQRIRSRLLEPAAALARCLPRNYSLCACSRAGSVRGLDTSFELAPQLGPDLSRAQSHESLRCLCVRVLLLTHTALPRSPLPRSSPRDGGVAVASQRPK